MTNEQIIEKIKNGISVTANMQLLYENNMPLIRQIIKPYTAYESVEDLLQEAYFGLWEAVKHYESCKNVLFMTYAKYWIKQSAQRYIEKCGSAVKIPSYVRDMIIRYNKTVEGLSQELSRIPTDKEVAKCMMISKSEVDDLRYYSQGVVSLDSPLTGNEELTLGDTIQSQLNLENDTIGKLYDEHTKNELWGIVENFVTERERHIIKEYFLHNKSMSQIAKEEGLSVWEVRKIKEKGIIRLRQGKAKRVLEEKFELAELGMYKTGFARFEREWGSSVEKIALKKLNLQKMYVN